MKYRRPEDGLIDEVAIERRMQGDKAVPLTRTERVELVRRWVAAGRSRSDCARVTGVNAGRYLIKRMTQPAEQVQPLKEKTT